jgi:hypothetical protein
MLYIIAPTGLSILVFASFFEGNLMVLTKPFTFALKKAEVKSNGVRTGVAGLLHPRESPQGIQSPASLTIIFASLIKAAI